MSRCFVLARFRPAAAAVPCRVVYVSVSVFRADGCTVWCPKLGLCRVHTGIQVDLMHQSVVLDRRILDWVVGLDTEISEIVEGSNLCMDFDNISTTFRPSLLRSLPPKRRH